MTAKERAEALYEENWDEVRVMPDEWIAKVASAIRAAEDEALERAAESADGHSVGFGCGALGDQIRSLKSKEGK